MLGVQVMQTGVFRGERFREGRYMRMFLARQYTSACCSLPVLRICMGYCLLMNHTQKVWNAFLYPFSTSEPCAQLSRSQRLVSPMVYYCRYLQQSFALTGSCMPNRLWIIATRLEYLSEMQRFTMNLRELLYMFLRQSLGLQHQLPELWLPFLANRSVEGSSVSVGGGYEKQRLLLMRCVSSQCGGMRWASDSSRQMGSKFMSPSMQELISCSLSPACISINIIVTSSQGNIYRLPLDDEIRYSIESSDNYQSQKQSYQVQIKVSFNHHFFFVFCFFWIILFFNFFFRWFIFCNQENLRWVNCFSLSSFKKQSAKEDSCFLKRILECLVGQPPIIVPTCTFDGSFFISVFLPVMSFRSRQPFNFSSTSSSWIFSGASLEINSSEGATFFLFLAWAVIFSATVTNSCWQEVETGRNWQLVCSGCVGQSRSCDSISTVIIME